VPGCDEGDFRSVFTPATFTGVPQRALFDDRGGDARAAYAARLFETDPEAASAQVMALVNDSQQPEWTVITP
jgi:hypothetical protein